MSLRSKKFEDLTKQQQKDIKIAGRKFVVSMFLNGVNFGGLIFFSNLVLIMANLAFFNSTPLLFVASVVVDIYLLNLMMKSNRETAEKFKEKVKNIVEAEQ